MCLQSIYDHINEPQSAFNLINFPTISNKTRPHWYQTTIFMRLKPFLIDDSFIVAIFLFVWTLVTAWLHQLVLHLNRKFFLPISNFAISISPISIWWWIWVQKQCIDVYEFIIFCISQKWLRQNYHFYHFQYSEWKIEKCKKH